VDEFRGPAACRGLVEEIRRAATRPWVLMEVCGGQTHAIVRAGIDQALAGAVELVHGPGCPVCVTPLSLLDQAHALAARPEVTLCTYGDMLRVPGSRGDLLRRRAEGADVRVVYSPLDALRLAQELRGREVVFFAVGFETTAPATAQALQLARRAGQANFSALTAHVLVPPAIEAVLDAPGARVQGFLGPGHVTAIEGTADYEALCARRRVPIVVAGFEPADVLLGVLECVRQLEAGWHELVNAYPRAVRAQGNPGARALVAEVFAPCDREWRGLGTIPRSGLAIRAEYAAHDAARRFALQVVSGAESPECVSGRILSGELRPSDCPAFGTRCTPERPLGATMVSSEGACAAYFACGRHRAAAGAGG
jgi:hydrogenase expression/formation protein HypD